MTKITEDRLREQLQEIAGWTGEISVPDVPTAEVTMLPLGPVHQQRARQVWAIIGIAAAMVVALVAVSTARRTPAPVADGRWLPMAEAPIPPRSMPATAWTGEEVIVAGGEAADGTRLRDAAAYNPATNTWRRLPDAPAPIGPGSQTALTQDALVIGLHGNGVRVTPVRDASTINRLAAETTPMMLDLDISRWQVLDRPGDLLALAALDGEAVALAAKVPRTGSDDLQLYRLDPTTRSWSPILEGLTPDGMDDVGQWATIAGPETLTFLPQRWLLANGRPTPGGFVLESTTGPITRLPALPLGRPRRPEAKTFGIVESQVAGLSGGQIVAVALANDNTGGLTTVARRYDPGTGAWAAVDAPPELTLDFDLLGSVPLTWTPFGTILTGGIDRGMRFDDGRVSGSSARTLLAAGSKSWKTLPGPALDLNRVGHVSLWTGRELVVWGGLRQSPGGPSNLAVQPAEGGARFFPKHSGVVDL